MGFFELTPEDWQALWLSFQLASMSTGLLVILCLPWAWWIARGRSIGRQSSLALSALPLALPPTVMGFYLLLFLGKKGPLHGIIGEGLAFSFSGIVMGSMLYSLPFVLHPLVNTFRAINRNELDAAATLGAGPWYRMRHVIIPQSWPGIVSAAVLGFAHTLGEFGVIVMIGGSIPKETQVASVMIFEYVESGQSEQAHALSLSLVLICLCLLITVYGIDYWRGRRYQTDSVS